MGLTIAALEAMGYKALSKGSKISGKFHRIEVFKIEGITIDDPSGEVFTKKIHGVTVRICFGASLNAACTALVGDGYTEDEKQWEKTTKSKPPYLLVALGPAKKHVGTGTHYQEHDDKIICYESFEAARDELRRQAESAIPSLVTSLTLMLPPQGRSVRFVRKHTAFAGVTDDGKTIHDFRIEFGPVRAYTSTKYDNSTTKRLKKALRSASQLDKNTAKFYYNGTLDEDALKRFLNFFFFIERHTHATFSAINHKSAVAELLSDYLNVGKFGKQLLEDHRNSWTDLLNRFVWCAMHKWTHLNENDIADFEKMKKKRDQIAHGSLSVPDASSVRLVEALASKLGILP